jgi:hypothetical protein
MSSVAGTRDCTDALGGAVVMRAGTADRGAESFASSCSKPFGTSLGAPVSTAAVDWSAAAGRLVALGFLVFLLIALRRCILAQFGVGSPRQSDSVRPTAQPAQPDCGIGSEGYQSRGRIDPTECPFAGLCSFSPDLERNSMQAGQVRLVSGIVQRHQCQFVSLSLPPMTPTTGSCEPVERFRSGD